MNNKPEQHVYANDAVESFPYTKSKVVIYYDGEQAKHSCDSHHINDDSKIKIAYTNPSNDTIQFELFHGLPR